MYPQGTAKCGAMDMSGNIWEWCANKYSKSENWRSLRGGSFDFSQHLAACAYRYFDYFPYYPIFTGGFRVVVAPMPFPPFRGCNLPKLYLLPKMVGDYGCLLAAKEEIVPVNLVCTLKGSGTYKKGRSLDLLPLRPFSNVVSQHRGCSYFFSDFPQKFGCHYGTGKK
jgi:hypothetical protein